jgi:hypothetical protein
MTYEVPSASDAKDEAGDSITPMMEGAAAGAGIEFGGGAFPVVGELVGGYVASLVQSNQGGKTFTRRMAAFEGAQRLIE